MYKKAAQTSLRFSYRGLCSVEDLFILSLSELDEIYKNLKRQERQQEEGLLEDRTEQDEALALRLAIVKDVFETTKAEIDARKAEVQRKARKQRILEIVADKQDADLADKSLDELQAMIDEL